MKYLTIPALLTIAFLAAYFYSQPAPAKAEPAKQVCIEAHLGINKSESIVLCGTIVNSDQFIYKT